MAYVSAFEVIAQPLAPGVPNVPFVQQGTFLQVTNLGPDTTIAVYYYQATPQFVSASPDGALTLFANYIDATGAIIQNTNFLSQYNGFTSISIKSNETLIFGVQYIFTPPANLSSIAMAGGTPQSTAQARGVIQIFATGTGGQNLLCATTVRQVFNNYDANGNVIDVDEAAYALPIANGPIIVADVAGAPAGALA